MNFQCSQNANLVHKETQHDGIIIIIISDIL